MCSSDLDTHENPDCKDTALTNALVPIDIPKEPTTGFGSLGELLRDIPAAYADHFFFFFLETIDFEG